MSSNLNAKILEVVAYSLIAIGFIAGFIAGNEEVSYDFY